MSTVNDLHPGRPGLHADVVVVAVKAAQRLVEAQLAQGARGEDEHEAVDRVDLAEGSRTAPASRSGQRLDLAAAVLLVAVGEGRPRDEPSTRRCCARRWHPRSRRGRRRRRRAPPGSSRKRPGRRSRRPGGRSPGPRGRRARAPSRARGCSCERSTTRSRPSSPARGRPVRLAGELDSRSRMLS